MTILTMTLLLLLAAVVAGLLGSLTGMGGGVVIIPLLTVAFGVDLRYAIGASLVSVIATSSGSAAAYVREGYSNIRAGMFLEVATVSGAIVGALVTARLAGHDKAAIALIFAGVLLFSVVMTLRRQREHVESDGQDQLARLLKLDSTYPVAGREQAYRVRHVPAGFAMMWLAGLLSGLLGIGSGAFKVLAMDQAMRLPFKVSTTTSNFMIGVTAAAGAGVYLSQGYIDPGLTMPVMLGVLVGSLLGARLLTRIHARALRWVFSVVIFALAIEMVVKALTGKL